MSDIHDQPWAPRLQMALEKHSSGDLAGALEDLTVLRDEYPDVAPINGMIGRACFEMGDYESAARFFRCAVKLSPCSELSSLGLFHSLQEIGRLEEAHAEMRRYLSVSSSSEYELIQEELASEPEEQEGHPG